MPNEELFSGIPALGDEQGLETFMNNAALDSMGIGNDTIPAALQVQTPAQPQVEPATPAQPAQAQPQAPQFTAEQVAQIIAQNQQLIQQNAQRQAQPQPAQSAQATSPYTPQQATIIKQLIDRGVSIERIQAALNGNATQNATQNSVMQRLANMEAYLQQQQYVAAQNEFIDKMTTFGDRFGLSEADLVTFGNKAMSMGINLTTVSDVEAVFRAVYPDQYAIRSQRLASAPSTPIYGGSSTPEAPRAATARMEDAYVEQFLKSSMPNQYGMKAK